MNKIRFVVVGKIKESFYREAIEEYAKRLSRFAELKIVEVEECKTLKEEAALLRRALKGTVIALAVEGKKVSSESFASLIRTQTDQGREISFLIGSSHGLDEQLKREADQRISFSDMTFPHQLMRVILIEQVYRAFMINAGSEYHK
ncbi:MAG: 23S rRNA (pseudouridine(1915)-N(3))-methyltransferase RlmH [Christensenellaceae bacterium]